jgi:hypothetical protein
LARLSGAKVVAKWHFEMPIRVAQGATTIYHKDTRTAVRPLAGCSVLLP